MNEEKKLNNKTLDYYNDNAQTFIDRTFEAQVSTTRDDFISWVSANADTENSVGESVEGKIEGRKPKILDVGAGSGRDTLYFLNKGLDVVAFDGSREVAKLASEKIGRPVLVCSIEDMPWEGEFDGVWAMASLLHLPKKDMPMGIKNCLRALKPSGGKFFGSLKVGEGEAYDEMGRFFSYYQPEEIKNIIMDTGLVEKVEVSVQGDTLGRSELTWLNFYAQSKPRLDLKLKSVKNKA